MFSEVEAARLLRVPQGTLHYWLEGGERRGKRYPPIIRERPCETRTVTWAEFVEAGLLRQYRRERGVPMAELRAVIGRLREELGVPYPLAHEQPFVGEGRQLTRTVQDEVGLDPESSSWPLPVINWCSRPRRPRSSSASAGWTGSQRGGGRTRRTPRYW